ncbi:MAG: hypothetical protein RIE58_10410 [Vicingaceae bacterium]
MKKLILISSFIFSLLSCSKDENPIVQTIVPDLSGGVIVLNEGSFQGNNASLTYRSPSGEVSQDLFDRVNGRKLGDILHSASIIDGQLFLVINNSQKIEALNPSNLKSVDAIEGFRSPRFIVKLAQGQNAWVSNFKLDGGENEIDIVNLNNHEKIGAIQVQGWCEQMLQVGNKLYIANTGSDQLIVAENGSLRYLKTPPQPTDMIVDADGIIWLLCSGGFQENQAALCKVDPETEQIIDTLRFKNSMAFPSKLVTDSEKKRMYFFENGLYSMSIYDQAIPEAPFIAANGSFYGLGIAPNTGNIFIGDAVDYSSKGKVHIYDANGVFIESFDAGYLPNGFLFR